jgi:hypothetical protein
MKKVILSMSIGLLLLASCSKENADTQIEEQTAALVGVYNFDGKVMGTLEINEPLSDSNGNTNRGNGNSAHTHGSFGPPNVISAFSGTENNGGAHGSANVRIGPWDFILETECVMVEENEAVYGGTITEINGPQTPPGFPEVGDGLYFRVIDNGQGSNADPDQVTLAFLVAFGGSSACGILTPNNPVWDLFGNGDVSEPGSIKVNNF